MNLTWKDAAKVVAEFAPTAGSLLGGPAGSAVGTLIAAALGTTAEPDKVLEAINNDPSAALKLKELELNHHVELERLAIQAEANRLAAQTAQIQEETKQVEAVNATMQTEAKSEHWLTAFWRPYMGVVTGSAFGIVAVFICLLAYKGIVEKDHEAMRMIPDLIVSMAELFAIPCAILGVTAWHRGKMQRTQAGESPTNLWDAVTARLKNKKEKAG